ncbi:hypothetical protein AAFF_G00161230 [Aldrovandia affinis]|uniref:Muscular LMNA-interacting protein n=1 Tax=Aldrovandia affinis TaxID=143900 RepID=A0AAD7RMS2_9TELE|nr:hypothetical protein AAFF_G00161230 [Aldrovandia affinis]
MSKSFVPVVKRLPTENKITLGEKRRQPKRRSNENLEALREAVTDQTMSEDGLFKAEFVYVGCDSEEGVPGDRWASLAREEVTPKQEAHSQLKLPADHMTRGPPTPPITTPSENTVHHFVNTSPMLKHASLEAVNDEQQPIDLHSHNILLRDKVCLGPLLSWAPSKSTPQLNHGVTHFAELLATPASSKESVLSEDWLSAGVLSSEGSLASLSRNVSPCSSVRSGGFSPSIIRVKRHSLVPGSSLAWNARSCQYLASDSPGPSPCPLSPGTERAWHRLPPTQLTLLTAILRKGRLPVLSPVQQRAYHPCWPISAITLSSCSACNAASKLAPICPGMARSQSQSAIEGPRMPPQHTHGPLSQCLRCFTPPDLTESAIFGPHVLSLSQSPEFSSCPDYTNSAWQTVTSPTLRMPKSIADRAGRRTKPYKIKLSYKAIAAIPTNTILLEQQAIDEEVEKEGHPLEATDGDRVTETHSEMCSPAQLRQQSEELYATIDQVLQDPIPMHRSHSAPHSLPTLTDTELPKRFTSLPRSAGRETKYATFNLHQPGSAERNMTKPGVIRSVTIIPKLTEEENEEDDYPNPFRQQYLEEMSKEQRHKLDSTTGGLSLKLSENHRDPGSPTLGKESTPRTEELLLLITEKDQTNTLPAADGSSKVGSASFNPAQLKTEVHETHI